MSWWKLASKPSVGHFSSVHLIRIVLNWAYKKFDGSCVETSFSDKWLYYFLPTDEGGTLKDASLVRMFLMMQPWYIPSTDMTKSLVLKYPALLPYNIFVQYVTAVLQLYLDCGKKQIFISLSVTLFDFKSLHEW